MHIWGCLAEVKVYNHKNKIFNLRTTDDFFIDYPKRSKGYRFYCSSHMPQIVETNKARFLKDDIFNGSKESQDIIFEKNIRNKF